MSAILTFLGGSAFRAVFGEISAWLTKRQEHKQELDRIKLQSQVDAQTHERQMNALRLQAELGVKTINVQADADVSRSDAAAFRDAVARAGATTGVFWVDAWNGCIRPAFATACLVLWVLCLHRNTWQLTEWDLSLLGAVVGYYFADRSLKRVGK